MVKVVALIRRKDGMSTDDFLRHWQVDHPAYVDAMPHVQRYVQSPVVPHRTPWPYDGLAELWFPSVGAVAESFASPAADALRAHEEEFIGALEWFLTEETPVTLPSVEKSA